MNPYAELEPDQLREAAKELAQPRNPSRHWTQMAAMIGTIDDRNAFFEWGFRSLRAWAESELDIAPEDTIESLKLWRLVKVSNLPLERWAQVSKAKAKIVARALGMGADAATWIDKAMNTESSSELMDAYRRLVGDEVWIVLEVPMPTELHQLVHAAMILALPTVLEDVDLPADQPTLLALATKRENAFRCLEVIVKEFVESHAGGQS